MNNCLIVLFIKIINQRFKLFQKNNLLMAVISNFEYNSTIIKQKKQAVSQKVFKPYFING
ncbi:MAG: hypothetical protein A2W91_14900 [Bacteroidetes bacterium GWF2_38_335]|nr:MAG: hypothetical protein A2W91_14900 [Bacteroidetes bacterium GWF2_38_335]OFY78487.1 MAG: hypothetical protein A2281_16210 [Bacteroidetes bacterium RIFOXYA12_FULL_38_20]